MTLSKLSDAMTMVIRVVYPSAVLPGKRHTYWF